MIDIKLNEEKKRSEAKDGEKTVGLCEYEIKEDVIDIYHTEVDKSYGGKGIAKKLLDEVVGFAKDQNKKIYPTCSYVRKKFDEDESYKDIDAR